MTLIPFEKPLEPARFLERPNRFIALIQHPAHLEPVKAHVADPGRLKELLLADAELLVADHGDNPNRKLRYSVALVLSPEKQWVSINSQLPNRLMKIMLGGSSQQALKTPLPSYEGLSYLRAEYTPEFSKQGNHKSRFDFLLETASGKPCLLEVKGASLVEGGICKFPDAPTVRGTRHLRELIESLKHGFEARVIFVVQRSDAKEMRPHYLRDPDFALALRDAIEAGVQVQAFCFHMSAKGCEFTGEISVFIPDLSGL